MLWSQHYASPEGLDEAILAVAVDSAGHVYGAGRANRPGVGSEMFMLKLDAADGAVLWTAYRGGDALVEDAAWAVVLTDGDPVVAGVVENTGGVAAAVTRRLAAADGAVVWERETPAAVAGIATASQWLAALDGGDVVLCSRAFGANGYDVVLQRFAAGDGATAWNVRYDGPSHGGDDPRGLLRTAGGDLVVFGVQDAQWNYDYMVLRFAAADGGLLWAGEGYDGPPGWYDVATCAAEAPDGTVVVAGLSDGAGTGWDLATVAYDPRDGTQLWVHRYDGPAGATDEARSVTVAADGAVFVTGYAYAGASGKDFLTLRLDPGAASAVPTGRPAPVPLRAWPNPANPRVELAFDLAAPGPVRLAVYDVRGARVALLHEGPLADGAHRVAWNGRDGDGNGVSAGTYLVRLQTPTGTAVRPVTLLP